MADFKILTSETIDIFAKRHYDNPADVNSQEFDDDMKRFKYIKRLLRKYHDSNILKERLLLNHIIILNNLFGPQACVTLLLFKLQREYWGALKSFLLFIGILREDELFDIEQDNFVLERLRKL